MYKHLGNWTKMKQAIPSKIMRRNESSKIFLLPLSTSFSFHLLLFSLLLFSNWIYLVWISKTFFSTVISNIVVRSPSEIILFFNYQFYDIIVKNFLCVLLLLCSLCCIFLINLKWYFNITYNFLFWEIDLLSIHSLTYVIMNFSF